MPRPARGRSSTARARQAQGDPTPNYEVPGGPLTDGGQEYFKTFAQSYTDRKFEQHLDKSVRLLSDAAGSINEAVYEQREWLQKTVARREKKSREIQEEVPKSDRELHVEARLMKVEKDVCEKTAAIEETLRCIVDYKAELQGERVTLNAAADRTSDRLAEYKAQAEALRAEKARSRRRKLEAEGAHAEEEPRESDDNEEPVEEAGRMDVTPVSAYREARDEWKRDYGKLTVYERYGSDNDYAAFRKLVHDAQFPNGEQQLPHAKKWFDDNGEPLHLLGSSRNGTSRSDEGDEDNELVVAGEHRDFRCPLSMAAIKDPVSSTKCPHSFEKAAFADYMFTSRGRATCPVSGCDKVCGTPGVLCDFGRKARADANRGLHRS